MMHTTTRPQDRMTQTPLTTPPSMHATPRKELAQCPSMHRTDRGDLTVSIHWMRVLVLVLVLMVLTYA